MQSRKSPELLSCPTVLISDQVATDDAFQHAAISRAIAEMILSRDQGGCAIALTGSWGSGKSTVVKLLADQLQATNADIQTFIFDAWAHQGDPLRRSFLEKLIGHCDQRLKWSDGSTDWNGVVEELARRREDVETTSTPRLTRWGSPERYLFS